MLPLVSADSGTIEQFSDLSYDIELQTDSQNPVSVDLTIQRNTTIHDASFQITYDDQDPSPGEFIFDIDEDGMYEWHLGGLGYGSLGEQTTFSNGASSTSAGVNGNLSWGATGSWRLPTLASMSATDITVGFTPTLASQFSNLGTISDLVVGDMDGDGIGNKCDTDKDGDGINNASDNCVIKSNPDQTNTDGDVFGDICDDDVASDGDGDGIADEEDNCILISNAGQDDMDQDGLGDLCDSDMDDDGVDNDTDAFPTDPLEDGDSDLDGVGNNADNCPQVENPTQDDSDSDGKGDACDNCAEPSANCAEENLFEPGAFCLGGNVWAFEPCQCALEMDEDCGGRGCSEGICTPPDASKVCELVRPCELAHCTNEPPDFQIVAHMYEPFDVTLDVTNILDDQTASENLEVRFDTNGDGIWDTPWNNEFLWTFEAVPGATISVAAAARDGEGLISTRTATVDMSIPTVVSGVLSTATWSGTVIVNDDIHLPEDQTLTVMPGTVVLFVPSDLDADGAGDIGMTVAGTMEVLGTAEQPTAFSVYSENPEKSDWAVVFTSVYMSLFLTSPLCQHALKNLVTIKTLRRLPVAPPP